MGFWSWYRRRRHEPVIDMTGPATYYPSRSGGYPPPEEPHNPVTEPSWNGPTVQFRVPLTPAQQ